MRVSRGIALVAVLACAALASPASARKPAPLPGPDLGPPDYGGYCQSLGFVRNAFTADKQWGCLHADNSITPLNVQAACEFTFTQRPIVARQITPGVLFTSSSKLIVT